MLKLKKWSNLLDSILLFFENFFGLYLTGFVILLMMIFVAFDVLSRKLFNISSRAIVDLVSLGMLIVVFCSLSIIQRDREHLSIDFLFAKLKGKILFVDQLIVCITNFATSLFYAYVSFEVLKYTIKFNVLSEGVRIQKWIFVIFIFISLSLLCIRTVYQIGNLFFPTLKTTNYEEVKRK